MVINSILLVALLSGESPNPPPTTPLTELDVAETNSFASVRSPKSCAFPFVAMVTNCITSDSA